MSADESTGSDFIRQIIRKDVRDGKNGGAVVTRFPPEPNGYLHIGHAKAFGLNFEIASEFGGRCHLRFDDTNPAAEELEYARSMEEDIRWLLDIDIDTYTGWSASPEPMAMSRSSCPTATTRFASIA